ncbi:maleylpyruvate isomerase N-terminal domain-containing protein [Streptomyces sp. RLB1-33]
MPRRRPVPTEEHCGEWTLHDLAGHLGSTNVWAAAAATGFAETQARTNRFVERR